MLNWTHSQICSNGALKIEMRTLGLMHLKILNLQNSLAPEPAEVDRTVGGSTFPLALQDNMCPL